MSDTRYCPHCGRELPANALLGLCPRCLLKAGFEAQSQGATGPVTDAPPRASTHDFVAPTVEELANVIPQIEILELVAKGGMGVSTRRQKPSTALSPSRSCLPTSATTSLPNASPEAAHREGSTIPISSRPTFRAGERVHYFDGVVDGVNLRHLLKQKGSSKKTRSPSCRRCEALQCPREGIMHRDIKPENILIDKKGRVKIADFGLAKLLRQEHLDDNLTATDQVMGTVRYMAPEQMEGARNIDHRADIYSLGVVFYELLTGELPLGRFAPPSKKVQIDVRLDEIVLRALEKEPNQRYQHAGDVKTEVESVGGRRTNRLRGRTTSRLCRQSDRRRTIAFTQRGRQPAAG